MEDKQKTLPQKNLIMPFSEASRANLLCPDFIIVSMPEPESNKDNPDDKVNKVDTL